MNAGVAFFVVFFFLGGESALEGNTVPSIQACEAQIEKLPALIAHYNEQAENPVKITRYATGCAPLNKAPQGKKV